MDSYPWGPHGPQSGPNEVTPNPTPSYVPPPASPSYYPFAPSPGSSGGGSGLGAGFAGYTGPRKKGYIVALILTFLFGPLGLFYSTKKGALAMLLLLVAVPVVLGVVGVLPGGSPSHPLAILDHDSVMNRMWSLSVLLSMLWSVVAVGRYNATLKSGE